MAPIFNSNPCTTIISCWSGTNVSDETDLIAFYIDLSPLVHCIPKDNVLIIGGDMNAQIGKNANKFILHNSSNRNVEHLTHFKLENRLTCLNTKFQKRKGKLWTYTYANNADAQIDYIHINKKWNNSALNWGCVLRPPIYNGKDTIELMKKCGPNNLNRKLWLVSAWH